MQPDQATNVAVAAFELAFCRRPASHELAAFTAALRGDIATSDALLHRLLALRGEPVAPEYAELDQLLESPSTSALLTGHGLDRKTYETAYATLIQRSEALVVGQDTYLPQHKERFWELFQACGHLLTQRTNPRLLEFGSSEFSVLYKRFFPNAAVHLSDRPTPPDYIGFTEALARQKLACDDYFAIDLEQVDSLPTGGPVPGSYDLILLCEVLEHLVVNPVDLLRALLALLKPDGRLYLTTPNLFRAENQRKWIVGENPQAVYPTRNQNWDRHHHHREYGAAELLRFIRAAGGRALAFYYSDCWDRDTSVAPNQRSNLVFLVSC